MDCLTYIFGELGMESLLSDVPLVCKSWYRASLDPSCWECLIFQEIETSYFGFPVETENWRSVPLLQRFVDEYQIDESRFSVTAFIKCGNLKGVALLRNLVTHKSSVILELIGKWKHLEFLILGSTHRLEEILSRISIHCKDLCALHLGNANIGKDEATAIVSFLPKIKSLFLRRKAEIGRDAHALMAL
ncbi:F-box protein FBW2 [Prunus persica]|uniref:F-box protein FBW2 n=1 Tax=Prunus persica TaxID=3760 RepID=UPI0009AB3E82|nr:F-box protein FBW2 [Prunus persica]